jgi:hypothetical protein
VAIGVPTAHERLHRLHVTTRATRALAVPRRSRSRLSPELTADVRRALRARVSLFRQPVTAEREVMI